MTSLIRRRPRQRLRRLAPLVRGTNRHAFVRGLATSPSCPPPALGERQAGRLRQHAAPHAQSVWLVSPCTSKAQVRRVRKVRRVRRPEAAHAARRASAFSHQPAQTFRQPASAGIGARGDQFCLIRGDQRRSEEIRGDQFWLIRGDQGRSGEIRGDQFWLIRGDQRRSEEIRGDQFWLQCRELCRIECERLECERLECRHDGGGGASLYRKAVQGGVGIGGGRARRRSARLDVRRVRARHGVQRPLPRECMPTAS